MLLPLFCHYLLHIITLYKYEQTNCLYFYAETIPNFTCCSNFSLAGEERKHAARNWIIDIIILSRVFGQGFELFK